jgi:hypothetical protein
MTPSTTPAPRVFTFLARRWPTLLAVALVADNLFGEVTDAATLRFAEAMLLLPLLYVVLAVVRRRAATWPVLVGLLALFVGLQLHDAVPTVPTVPVLLAVALGASLWGVGHQLHREGDFRRQLAGMAGFGALAVTALLVDPDLTRYLVAAGWFAHGVWDAVHLVRNRVVARSFAEWCAVVDVTIAVSLVAAPLL